MSEQRDEAEAAATGGVHSVRERSGDYTRAEAAELLRKQGARIRGLRNQAHLTIQELADRAGLHFNTVGRIERGESEATTEHLLLIARALNTAPAQLVHYSGNGPGMHQAPLGAHEGEFALVPVLKAPARAGDAGAQAGAALAAAAEPPLGPLAFRRDWLAQHGLLPDETRVMFVRGDAMADRINAGDVLLVNTAVRAFGEDGLYVIELDGLDYVKFLTRDFSSGGAQVISFNAAYKPQALSAAQVAALRISGRVVWRGGEL